MRPPRRRRAATRACSSSRPRIWCEWRLVRIGSQMVLLRAVALGAKAGLVSAHTRGIAVACVLRRAVRCVQSKGCRQRAPFRVAMHLWSAGAGSWRSLGRAVSDGFREAAAAGCARVAGGAAVCRLCRPECVRRENAGARVCCGRARGASGRGWSRLRVRWSGDLADAEGMRQGREGSRASAGSQGGARLTCDVPFHSEVPMQSEIVISTCLLWHVLTDPGGRPAVEPARRGRSSWRGAPHDMVGSPLGCNEWLYAG